MRRADWCIRQPTKPHFEAYRSGDSAVFLKPALVCAMAICVQWKMEDGILIQWAKSHGSHADASTKRIPICLSEVKRSMQQGDYLQTISFYKSTMQYCSFEKRAYGRNIYDPIKRSNLRCSNNDLVECSEAGTCKMLFPPRAWAHRLGNSWLACFTPSALSRKSLASLLCTGSVENTQKSMQQERLPDSSFNILPASTHFLWSPHLSDVSSFFYEKQNIMPSFPL